MKHFFNYCLVVFLTLVLVAGINESWSQHRANVLFVPVQNKIDLWANNLEKPTKEEWKEVLSYIDEAVSLQSSMPEYYLSKAKVLEWGWFLGLAVEEDLAQLPNLYKKAQQLRPLWGQAYADEAWYWQFIGHDDSKTSMLLSTALKLSPYIPEVMFRHLTVELRRWHLLTPQEKLTLYNNTKLLFTSSLKNRTLGLIRSNNKQHLFCLFFRQQIDLPARLVRDLESQLCR